MEREALASAARNYPDLQGLWAIPMGFGMFVAAISNLGSGLSSLGFLVLLGAAALVCGVPCLLIARYYRDNYGRVTPTIGRQVRHGVAVVAWVAVLAVGANKHLLWSPDSSLCVFAAAFALATLAYYAILVGVRAHHVAIWGIVIVAALLPIWGGLGADRDALAMFPLGVAFIASGLLDQRLLVRSFASSKGLDPESGHVGA